MSLSITMLSRDFIYQSADFRLTDTHTNRPRDIVSQKAIVLSRFHWSAVVSFVGVGHTGRLDVAEWLATRTARIPLDAPFDGLIAALLEADAWLRAVPRKDRRHTFSVGAFVGTRPQAVLVSNFESLHAPRSSTASERLSVSKRTYPKPAVLVSGVPSAVRDNDRLSLRRLLVDRCPHQEVYEALAEVNARAAQRNSTISPACFTAHVRITGDGGAMPHGLDESRDYILTFSAAAELTLNRATDEQGRPRPIQLKSTQFVTAHSTEEYHRLQLKHKPDDPQTHCNYGTFLADNGDFDGAEEAYLKALSLDPKHTNALGDYAAFLWRRGDLDGAERYFREVLAINPWYSLYRARYAEFLYDARQDFAAAERVYREGFTFNEQGDTALLLSFARFQLMRREYAEAARLYEGYTKLNPTYPDALTEYAIALYLSGGDHDRCVALYRQALSRQPDLPIAMVNLAQLLFCGGCEGGASGREANELLERCLSTEVEQTIRLEAWFYRYAHLRDGRDVALGQLRALVDTGARSPEWDLRCNVERADRDGHPERELIGALADVICGRAEAASLDRFEAWTRLEPADG